MKVPGIIAHVALLVLSATTEAVSAYKHAAFHDNKAVGAEILSPEFGLAAQDLERRQDDINSTAQPMTTTAGLQTFSTTYTYSYWSYTATTQASSPTFGSSEVTTSTVLTVSASDQFHAFQSLLTAAQSVQDDASSSAAQALQMIQTPAHVVASATMTTADTTSSTGITSADMTSSMQIASTPFVAPLPVASIILSAVSPVSSTQTGGAFSSACARPHDGLVLAIAAALLSM